MTNVVTAEYIEGVREGIERLRLWNAGYYGDTEPMTANDMREEIACLTRSMRLFSPGPVKDMFKGERDFWKLQVKKLGTT